MHSTVMYFKTIRFPNTVAYDTNGEIPSSLWSLFNQFIVISFPGFYQCSQCNSSLAFSSSRFAHINNNISLLGSMSVAVARKTNEFCRSCRHKTRTLFDFGCFVATNFTLGLDPTGILSVGVASICFFKLTHRAASSYDSSQFCDTKTARICACVCAHAAVVLIYVHLFIARICTQATAGDDGNISDSVTVAMRKYFIR